MSKKLILTSLTAIAFTMPAMATPTNTSSTFPNDELMLQDYTYQNQANYTNMGVYDGSVNAVAEYDPIYYDITAGQYLAQATTSGTGCPANSFCGGLTHVEYDAENDQGILSCSTLDNGAFPNSAANSSLNTQCYRACDASNMGSNGSIATIAHATVLSGNDYYGNGTDTCVATGCESGWHVDSGACAANIITINWSDASAADISANNAGTATYGSDIRTPRAATAKPGKTFKGWKFVKPETNSSSNSSGMREYLLGLSGSAIDDYSFIGQDGNDVGSGHQACMTGLSYGDWCFEAMAAPDDFESPYVPITGRSVCSSVSSTTEGDIPANQSQITAEYTHNQTSNPAGNYCYCQLQTANGNPAVSSWVYQSSYETPAKCANNCAMYCAVATYSDAPSSEGGITGIMYNSVQ